MAEEDRYANWSDEKIIELENKFGASHYARLPLVVRKARDCWLTDKNGKRYLDCMAGYSANNQGNNHPVIGDRLKKAIDEGRFGVLPNVLYTAPRALLLQKIATIVPLLASRRFRGANNKVMLKSSGVDAFEIAVKILRKYGYLALNIPDGKQKIIVAENNFHGRTIEAIAASSHEHYRKGFGASTEKYIRVEFNNLAAFAQAAKRKNVCGILIEPVQGEGGVNIPADDFLPGLKKIADKHNILLAFDEIQTGLGRTGKMFCFEHYNVLPDVLTLGKALSGGHEPLSACITNSKLMDMIFQPGVDGQTYGGYSAACEAGLAALEVIENEKLVENAVHLGKILGEKLKDLGRHSAHVQEARGKGLMWGMEIVGGNAMKYCRQLLDLGIFTNDAHGTIRITPPLNIDEEGINFFVKRLEKVLKS